MWYCRTRSVGVGFPNPLGEVTSPPRWIPRHQLCRIYPPAGRHVYSTRHTPNIPKPQRGDMYSLSESQIRLI